MLRVEHECEVMTKHEDILLLPERSFFRKALHNFRRLLMASDKNPGARKYLRSRLSIIVEKRRHLRHYKRIIHPFSVFRYIPLMNSHNLPKTYLCKSYTYVIYVCITVNSPSLSISLFKIYY